MSPATALADQAEEFARQISEILSAFTGTDCPFDAVTVDGQAVIRQRVSPGDPEGIGLNSNGQTLLSMVVRYECTWDSDKQYLSVETSAIKVYPLRRVNKEPLFRYEYIRTPDGTIPSAHLQVHAHRDSFTHLLGWAGQHSARARQRSAAPMDQTPSLSKFHFPLGGPRFRPSIEDVLDVLQEEFGLETGSQWQEVRDRNRRQWRLTQIASAVRDAPEEAVRVLRELGYEISGEPKPHREKSLLRL